LYCKLALIVKLGNVTPRDPPFDSDSPTFQAAALTILH
jgi:hypothetical protein